MVPSLLCIFVAHIIFLHVFFLPPFPSLSLSLSLSPSPPSFSLWLQDTCHLMPFTKYPLLNQSYFFTPYPSIAHIKFTNYSHLFTDYLLRLPSSELLEKHLFRSRANHRLVSSTIFYIKCMDLTTWSTCISIPVFARVNHRSCISFIFTSLCKRAHSEIPWVQRAS